MTAAFSKTKPIYDSMNSAAFAYASTLYAYPDGGYGNPIYDINVPPPFMTHCGRLVGIQNRTQSYTCSRSPNALSQTLLKTNAKEIQTKIWVGKNFGSSDWNYSYDFNKIMVRIRIYPTYTFGWQTLNIDTTYKGETFLPIVGESINTWTNSIDTWQINPTDKIILDIFCGNLTGSSTSFWFSAASVLVDHKDYYPIIFDPNNGYSLLNANGEAKADKKYFFFYPTGDLIQFSSDTLLKRTVKIEAKGGVILSGISKIRRRWDGQGGIVLSTNNFIGRSYIPPNVSIHVDEKKKLLAWWPLDYNPQNPFFAEDIQKNLYTETPKSKITRFLWEATSVYNKINYIGFTGPIDPMQVANIICENNAISIEGTWLWQLQYNFFENDPNNYIKFRNSVYGNLPAVQGDGFTRLKTIFLNKYVSNVIGISPVGPTTEYYIRHKSKLDEASNNIRFKIIGRYYNSSSFVFSPGDQLIFFGDKLYIFTYQSNNTFKFEFDMEDYYLYLAATGLSGSADLDLFSISNYLNTSFLPILKINGGQPKLIHGLLENDTPSYDISGNMQNTYLLNHSVFVTQDYQLYFKNAPFDYNKDFNYNGFNLTINKIGNQGNISLSGTNNQFSIQFNGTFVELELCYDSDLNLPRPDLTIGDIDLFVPGTLINQVDTHGYLTNMSSSNWSQDVPLVLQKTKGKLGYENFNQYSVEFNNTNINAASQFISFDIEGQSKIFNIGTDDFSVCCWVKPAIVQNSAISSIVTKILLDSRGWAIILLNIEDTNDYVVLGIAQYDVSGEAIIVPGSIINDNKWHHITMTKDATNITLYVDGINYGSSNHTVASLNNTLPLDQQDVVFRIGDISGVSDARYNYLGKIDDVRIYKKTLSDQEVLDLYQAGDITTAIITSPDKKYTASLNPIKVSGTSLPGLLYTMNGGILSKGVAKTGIRINASGECLVKGIAIVNVKRRYIIRDAISISYGMALITKRGVIGVGGIRTSGIAFVRRGYNFIYSEGILVSGEAPHRKEIFGSGTQPAKRSHNPEGGLVSNGLGICSYKREFQVVSGSVERFKKHCGSAFDINFSNVIWSNPNGITSVGFLGTIAQDNGRYINYKQTNYLRAMNFNFNIPANSIIVGVELEIDKLLATITPLDLLSNIRVNEISLVIDNNKFNSNVAYSMTIPQNNLYSNYKFGGSNNLWNANLSLGQVNSVNFGFSIQIEYKTTYEVQTNIFIDNVFGYIYFIKPIVIQGVGLVTNRMIYSDKNPIFVKGGIIPYVIRNVIYPKINLEIEGESIVRLPFPARHYGNGSIKVKGSAKVNFVAKIQSFISISGSAESVRVLPFVTGKREMNWHDEFERSDNYDIG